MRSTMYIDPRYLRVKKPKVKKNRPPRVKREHKGRVNTDIWKDFTPSECEIFHQIYMDTRSGLLMPDGLHFPASTLREIAAEYAVQSVWSLRKVLKKQEEIRNAKANV